MSGIVFVLTLLQEEAGDNPERRAALSQAMIGLTDQ